MLDLQPEKLPILLFWVSDHIYIRENHKTLLGVSVLGSRVFLQIGFELRLRIKCWAIQEPWSSESGLGRFCYTPMNEKNPH